MDLFDKAKDGIKTGVKYIEKGAKYVGNKVGEVVTTIKEDIEDTKAEKVLNEKLTQQFNLNARQFTMVIPGENIKLKSIYGRVKITDTSLTFLGEVRNLTPEVYFIDEDYKKYEISLLKLKQSMDIVIDNVIHPCTVSVVEYHLVDDIETVNQMKELIENNQED